MSGDEVLWTGLTAVLGSKGRMRAKVRANWPRARVSYLPNRVTGVACPSVAMVAREHGVRKLIVPADYAVRQREFHPAAG